ncbi:iron/manganese ABC transporter substrate-binding protein YfeA [Yersinia enterocolitica]|uniref:iron/manganese ABC transporter substrate-binding protein YfeA n=1 Tax=Yersinia enterocolitica TaxID=630 RepID=UPI000D824E30|nr:iron/manganese ABC transporter substrate-binding protein YfeA [Yersinia enterocolitica]SQA41138.1 periplasmic-binding protein [Yersinia enterocolitica]SUP66927.1 periplasmic-binding protein [Yersinia enterocolitica]HDM8274728.1 iron/manganese ABC transporter substrate-binding protein YfeA [Yersinia enterocolitica]HED5567605.1 iron/manganese ABC transporter substrate-binding protein YfeA [Yersinia enterocolitica]
MFIKQKIPYLHSISGFTPRFLHTMTLFTVVAISLLMNTSAWAENQPNDSDKKFKIVTTFTIIQDIAQNVAGDAAIVESITKPGAEIHDYQPTPRDIVKAQSADLILWNGMNLERWFERFFENIKDVPSAVVTDGIIPLPIREGPYKGIPNPHAWMPPSNALIYIENIRKALVEHDPAHAETYNRNAKTYAEKIAALDAPLRERLSRIPQEQRWLVTSEGAFSYLAKDYGFKEVYLWPINAEEQGSPQQVRRVIDTMRTNKIPVIFSESTISDKPARQVSKETGAQYGGVLYVDSLSNEKGPVPTYIDLINTTVQTIAKGFGQ